MSHDPPTDPPPPRSPIGGRGCIIALLIVVGVLLLLPGICSILFIKAGMPNDLASAGLFVSGVGVAMIIVGIVWLTQARRARL